MSFQVRFRTLDEFYDFLPPDELKVAEYLRDLVFRCIPDIKERLSYNVAYFKRHQDICFIWPGSILWGKERSYDGVRFGFTKGFLLDDNNHYLARGNRKHVYWRDFLTVKDIDVRQLESLLYQAAIVDRK